MGMDDEAKKQALMKMFQAEQMQPRKFPDTGREASSISDGIDSYVAGPIKAGLVAASNEQLKPEVQDAGFFSAKHLQPVQAGWNAIKNQFGNDPHTAPTGKVVAEKMGMDSTPLSQMPLINNLFKAREAKYQGGGASDRLLGIPSPSEGKPDLMRAGGPLDVSPAGVVGLGVDSSLDPIMATNPSKALGGIKVLNPALHKEAAAKAFAESVEAARAARPDVVKNVSQYTPEEYAKMRTFLSPDKKSGFALKPTDKGDELVNVFSSEKGLNRGDKIMSESVDRGAQTLDALDGYLPKRYEQHGFKEYKREPNWTPGEPDVVYMSQPNNPKLSGDDLVKLQEAGLPPELRREFPSQTPVSATAEELANSADAAKQARFNRVNEMLQNRRKARSTNLDEVTQKINKAK